MTLNYTAGSTRRQCSHKYSPWPAQGRFALIATFLLVATVLLTGCLSPAEPDAEPGKAQVAEAIRPATGDAPSATTSAPRRPMKPPLRAPVAPADQRWPGVIDILGWSTNGHPIRRYQLGSGPSHLVLIGGIHGGAEWNTVALAYELIDHISANPSFLPTHLRLSIIPLANPDGLVAVGGTPGRITRTDLDVSGAVGRMNGNDVDLNRNWDCQWQPTSRWQSRMVSAGSEPFSEVETRILRDYLLDTGADAVVFWHSRAAGVFPGWCQEPFGPSRALGEAYAAASGYTFAAAWTAYPVTGDAGDWLATQGIPAITVELKTHQETDWTENLAGVEAVMQILKTGALW